MAAGDQDLYWAYCVFNNKSLQMINDITFIVL